MTDTYQCIVCDSDLPGLTGQCPSCKSRYRRGSLITEGTIQKRGSVRSRIGVSSKPIDFAKLPWVSYQQGHDRKEAIENLWAFYRKYPRKYARKDPSEMYEVTRAIVDRDRRGQPVGVWELTVRHKVKA